MPTNPEAGKPGPTPEGVITRLVQQENERLTRLLRNLYQEFRLGQADRSQLYEHICRELAQYFHCDCCELYLLEHRPSGRRGRYADVEEVIPLVAAFGPWQQALTPQHVRRRIRTEYALDAPGHTPTRFCAAGPVVDICRRDFGKTPPAADPTGAPRKGRKVEWHLVWRRDNLYSISRNILSCPIWRHRSRGRGAYPIGLLKLENRRPFLSRAFESDCETDELFLGPYFELLAVAAYVSDLRKRLDYADTAESCFHPLHDSDGWHQHFQEHEGGRPYFEEVRKWLEEQEREAGRAGRQAAGRWTARQGRSAGKATAPADLKRLLRAEYRRVEKELAPVMDRVVEIETLLQEVLTACRVLWRREEVPSGFAADVARLRRTAPMPSFFNAVGLDQFGGESVEPLRLAVLDGLGLDPAAPEPDPADSGPDPDLDRRAACRRLVEDAVRCQERHRRPRQQRATLWHRLQGTFREKSRGPDGLLAEAGRDAAVTDCLNALRRIAQGILGCRQGEDEQLTSPIQAAFQCADAVLEALDDASEGDEVRRLARASAAACMYAHTFDDRLDPTRLQSLQSHVSQVLDNYLTDKARLSGTSVSFDHVEILGLTDSSIDGLDRFQKLLEDTARCLSAAIWRWDTRSQAVGGDGRGRLPINAWVLTPDVPRILGELAEAALRRDETARPVALLEGAAPLPKGVGRAAMAKLTEPLALSCGPGKPVRVELQVSRRDFYDSACADRAPECRPVPYWLFAANAALTRYLRDLGGAARGKGPHG